MSFRLSLRGCEDQPSVGVKFWLNDVYGRFWIFTGLGLGCKPKIAPAGICDLPLTAAGEQEKHVPNFLFSVASGEELLELLFAVPIRCRVDVVWDVATFFLSGECEGELDVKVIQKSADARGPVVYGSWA